jgi:hypothetical protein
VPELRVAEQRVVGVDQPLVAAPVDVERLAAPGAALGLEVGVDVGAAEGVDRLLGVADEDERRAAVAERALHDAPLHRVGVLELVDEHDAVLPAEALGDEVAAVGLQRAVQPREQVVVRHDAEAALAAVELLADLLGEPPSPARRRLRRGVRRLERGVGVAHRLVRDPERLVALDRDPFGAVERAQVQIVDDLLDEVAEVLDELDPRLEVAGDAEAAQDLLAEAVRRDDRRGVEVGDGACEPSMPLLEVLARPGDEQGEHLVALGVLAPERELEPALGAHEPLPHAVAQLRRRVARERHDEQLVQAQALGDVARGEARDRERLAGAGARLEHRDAGRQGAADVERPLVGRLRGHRSWSLSTSSSGVHRRIA